MLTEIEKKKLRKGIVKILKNTSESGEVAGTGFLVKTNLLVTCAHVFKLAAGEKGSSVKVVLLDSNEELFAERTKYYSDLKDIAVLKLRGLFANSIPFKLDTKKDIGGHPFSTYGFPGKLPSGMFVEGTIKDGNSDRTSLQLSSPDITHGVSGAPVANTQTRRVLGIIRYLFKDTYVKNVSFAIPTSVLLEVCPILSSEDAICPYRGLQAFTEYDERFFYGRDNLIRKLIEELRHNPYFLAVFGASGSGKSSVVQAGLLPKLQGGEIPGFEDCKILQFRLGQDLRYSLSEALLKKGTEFQHMDSDNDDFWIRVESEFEQDESGLKQSFKRYVIFIDQFEELFAFSSEVQEDFTQGLVRLAQVNRLTLILAIRSDFYAQIYDSPLKKLLGDINPVNISEISPEELKEIIIKPAEEIELRIETGLADLILNDLENSRILEKTASSLPLLEVTLERLWRSEHHNNLLTIDCYTSQKIGRVSGAVTQWANEIKRKLETEEEQEIVLQILLSLIRISPDPDVPTTRRRRTVNELINQNASPKTIRPVIRVLAEHRLIITGKDSKTKEETIEIIHEALFREWSWLDNKIEPHKNNLRKIGELEREAQQWKREGQLDDPAYLLTGQKLSGAENFISKVKESSLSLTITPDIIQFIQVSRKAQRKIVQDLQKVRRAEEQKVQRQIIQVSQKARRQNRLVSALGIAILLSLGSFLWARYRQGLGENYIHNLKPGTLADPAYLHIIEPLIESNKKIANESEKITEVLANYRQTFLYLSLLDARKQDTQDSLELSPNETQQIEVLLKKVERDFLQLIKTKRLPILESELQSEISGNQNTEWREVSSIASKRTARFEPGALQTTYRVIHDDFGVGADIGGNAGVIDKGEELIIPCSILREVENLWREHTNCGWFNVEDGNLFDDSNCLHIKSGDRSVTLTNVIFEDNLDHISKRIRNCFSL